ncbi:MAG TPA: ABC transporter ATP-binding protein [Candidatus Saccharimonadales bacterium]|nr:ABC transporter ATP-binding protein [Candidatus Saccharimonadales bacterium]
MSIISVKDLTKIYGAGHTAVKAVDKVSLEVGPGDIVLIMGPSGSGKTTLISMIGTLLRPTEGSILINDQALAKFSSSQLADFRLNTLGFVFQSFNLLAALTAEQNVMLPAMARGATRAEAKKRARTLLHRLGLQHRLNNLPRDLSGGEKQRVAIGRALVNEPKMILADEPTANLDSKSGKEVSEMLCGTACEDGRAVIIVSHDARLRDVAKRVITIQDGKLVHEEAGSHNKFCRMKH